MPEVFKGYIKSLNYIQTQKDYILEYVLRIDELLEASLSHEVPAEEDKQCQKCDNGMWAVWRCRDCCLGLPMCRACMRSSHQENPFHRIEQWNGNFYRHAELWEVGTHLFIRHHTRNPLCDTLLAQKDFLELAELGKDNTEQESLNTLLSSASNHSTAPVPGPAPSGYDNDIDMSHPGIDDEGDDEQFMSYLDELRSDGRDQPYDGEAQDEEIEDELDVDETDVPVSNQYLPKEFNTRTATASTIGGSLADIPVMGTYIRVVHTNGIHNIAMVSCECRGHDVLPCDLLAVGLVPASFQRIRTIFTAQLLDYFRLCNLELKASAYQFYHLLQRLTCPMAPAEVVNLYRELRRMSRLWRWMKRLKWAGYGSTTKKASDVSAGQLTIFCPACPQPGINIPDNWIDDPSRQVVKCWFIGHNLYILHSWLYKRVFVADGNFKADHVRQNSSAGDVWLSEGAGMIPTRDTYKAFLQSATERLTVSRHSVICESPSEKPCRPLKEGTM
jgi:hypothetical protein